MHVSPLASTPTRKTKMEYFDQIEGLSDFEVKTIEKAAKLINKLPQTPWSASEINEAFDHQEGSLAIDRVLNKVSTRMGYTHEDVLASR